MRSTQSIVAAAGLGLATLAAAASPAFASNNAGPGGGGSSSGGGSGAASAASVTISPSTVQPGDTVTVELDCSAYSNPKPTWRSTSAFSDPVSLSPMSGQPGFFSGSATVSASIQAGSYTISGACTASAGNSQFQGNLQVGAADQDGGGYHMPQGNAHTGVGGSITGGDTTSVAAGGVLLAGAGLLTLRRRRTRDGR
ncbi:LPXTG cell wall anchor domain-containing protein [Streptacidiphilus sp. PB12-B1b]|uniref:LPXTG cell wall anchor domain-containing protein n=1 Tax=Streptacidiphilus sp. PB12-B1b TaxID=2705012 RepID=UPI0015FC7054|nr:LPXTG cell wall anchor domain-containing protein [Streptacidiphilus sp. PB12-B1b]QMU77764.1 LPXTG cell wall anchor domain-containing protein [Streptacidiphilus sp. PB12-B1b]